MGLSCQKTQVTGWGRLSCREQTGPGTWKEAGCRCIVWRGGGKGAPPGVSGPVSQLPHAGLCIRLYTEIGVLHSGPWGRDQSFVVPPLLSCNLWPQVPSLSRLQGDGQGLPCPHLLPPRYTAHIQVHHHLEHTALPARVKTQSGGLQFKRKQCQRLRAEGTGPHLQTPSSCHPSDVTFLPTQRGDDVTRQMSSELLRAPDVQDWIQ